MDELYDLLKAKYTINSTIELSNIGLPDTLKKHYNEPVEHEANSIVAGPTFIQYLNKLFKIQIAARQHNLWALC